MTRPRGSASAIRNLRRLTAPLGLLVYLMTPLARAQAPAEPLPLTPPRLRAEAPVPYPERAAGEHRVVLRLRIGADGRVAEATALEGEEPFTAAALAAIRGFRFDPATREGKPIASYIRFLVHFTPPAASAPGAASTAGASGASGAPTGAPGTPGAAGASGAAGSAPRVEAEDEVTVLGAKVAPGGVSMGRAEVRQLPGAFGDPFRAIEALPGVTPLISGAPFFYVRGAPPGNVGYFLDGVRVPYLFHVFLGPSVVNPALVQRVDLHPGGYPARLGRFAGGVVEGETTPPVAEAHGEAVLRLFDAGALVEAPFAGGRGTALVGGRYSYTALLFSLLSPGVKLDYWDYQGRLSYRVSPTATVSVFAFGARDFLGEKEKEGTRTFFDAQFHRVDLRYDDDLGGRGSTRLAATLGLDRTGGEGGDALRSRSARLRSQTTRPLGGAAWTFGADIAVESYDNQPGQETEEPPDAAEISQQEILTTRQDLATGGHVEAAFSLGPVAFVPGLRVDLYASSDSAQPARPGAGVLGGAPARGRIATLAVEPRLAVRAALTPWLRAIHTVGLAHQPPSFVVPLPGFQPSPLRGGLQRSLQASAGIEAELGAGITGSATVFRSLFTNLSDALGTRPTDSGGPDLFESRADGTGTGLEIHLRRALTRRLGGYLSYTLSRSDRRVAGPPRVRFPSNFDRTHVLSAALARDLGRRWRAGARLVFYTGIPVTDPARFTPSRRTEPFHRIDVRLEKSWRLGPHGKISFVIEVLNTTLRAESFGQRCDQDGCRDDKLGPVFVPSVGVEAVF